MLKLKDVFVLFNVGTPQEKVALRGLNCTINGGEIVTLVGNKGSGRSTFLQFLAGYCQPSFGRLWIDNRDITYQTLAERSERFAFVSYNKKGSIAENLTVAENLAVASLHHQDRSFWRAALDDDLRDEYYEQLKSLNFFAMEEVLDQKAHSISHMHKFILALLIAVMKNTEVLLVDDHVSGLPEEEEKILFETIMKIVKSQKSTTIIAMSNPAQALSIADHTLVMSRGQLVADLVGESKKKTKVEDLFASFKIVPKMKDAKASTL